MLRLKRITNINILLYGIFVCMNVLETCWNAYLFKARNKLSIADTHGLMAASIKTELKLHTIFNICALITLVVFLLICNQLVKRNELGKPYHFLIILLSFFPMVNLVLFFIVWRKLNKYVCKYFHISPKWSDRMIVLLWVTELFRFLLLITIEVVRYTSKSPELITRLDQLQVLYPLMHSVYLLGLSFVYLFYFLHFSKGINQKESGELNLLESELID